VEGISILSVLGKMNGIKNAIVRGADIWIIGTDLQYTMTVMTEWLPELEGTLPPVIRPLVYGARRSGRSQRITLPSKLGEQMPSRRTTELDGCDRITSSVK
jgi:hypothetical protein